MIRIPPSLKIHQSFVFFADAIFQEESISKTNNPNATKTKLNQLKTPKTKAEMSNLYPFNLASDLPGTEIIASIGLGIFDHKKQENKNKILTNPNTKSQSTFSIEHLRSNLLQRNPIRDLEVFIASTSHSSHKDSQRSSSPWFHALTTLRNHHDVKVSQQSRLSSTSPNLRSSGSKSGNEEVKVADEVNPNTICPDSVLSLSIESSMLQIGGLDEYFASLSSPSLQKSCVVSLVSHLINTYENILDIRVTGPSYQFNYLNKGIVQAKSYSETYPYHNVGLDGTGEIIGIGELKPLIFDSSFILIDFR